jgi:copper chaperone CopZ
MQYTYPLTGLTCGHCAQAVTEEVSELAGVSEVGVDLVAGGTSTLRLAADAEPDRAALTAAVKEAGDAYALA